MHRFAGWWPAPTGPYPRPRRGFRLKIQVWTRTQPCLRIRLPILPSLPLTRHSESFPDRLLPRADSISRPLATRPQRSDLSDACWRPNKSGCGYGQGTCWGPQLPLSVKYPRVSTHASPPRGLTAPLARPGASLPLMPPRSGLRVLIAQAPTNLHPPTQSWPRASCMWAVGNPCLT